MRRVTRNLLVVLGLVIVGLLALGALPSHLGTGDPYHLTVEPVDREGPAVVVDDVSDRRFPYLVGALESDEGRSDGYRTGPYGLKEHFTHSPFDEVDAIRQRNPDAIENGGVYVAHEGDRFYVEVVQEEA